MNAGIHTIAAALMLVALATSADAQGQGRGKPAAGVRVAAMVPPDPGFNAGNASELAAIGKTDDHHIAGKIDGDGKWLYINCSYGHNVSVVSSG